MNRSFKLILFCIGLAALLGIFFRKNYFSSQSLPQNRPSHSISKILQMKTSLQPQNLAAHQRTENKNSPPSEDESLLFISIEKNLDNDEACLFLNRPVDSLGNQSAVYQKVLAKVLTARMKSPLIRSLFSEEGQMQGVTSNDASNRITLFYNALLYANLLDGVQFKVVDYPYSLQLLDSLQIQDPKNGVYAHYSAFVRSLSGESAEKQRGKLLQAFQAPLYDNFLMLMVKEIHEDLIQNATLWIALTDFLSEIPIPLVPQPNFIRKNFPDPTEYEAQLIADFGFRLNQSKHSLVIEWEIGKYLVKSYWSKAYPKKSLPRLRELISEVSSGQFQEDVYGFIRDQPCNRAPLDREYKRAKAAGFPWQ